MWCVPVAAQPRAHNPAAPTTAGSICKLIYRAQGCSCSIGHAGEASRPSQCHGLSVQAPSMSVAVAAGLLSCGLPRAWWAAKLAGMKLQSALAFSGSSFCSSENCFSSKGLCFEVVGLAKKLERKITPNPGSLNHVERGAKAAAFSLSLHNQFTGRRQANMQRV